MQQFGQSYFVTKSGNYLSVREFKNGKFYAMLAINWYKVCSIIASIYSNTLLFTLLIKITKHSLIK